MPFLRALRVLRSFRVTDYGRKTSEYGQARHVGRVAVAETAQAHDIRDARQALGRQLAELRRAAGYTQHSFAPMTLYGRSTVANAETGHQRPDRGFWQRCDEILQTGGLLTTGYDNLVALERHHRQARSAAASTVLTLAGTTTSASDDDRTAVCDLAQADGTSHGWGEHPRPPTPAVLGVDAEDTAIVAVVIEGRHHQLRLSRRALLEAMSGSLAAPVVDGVAIPAASDTAVPADIVHHFAALRSVLVESDNRLGAAVVLPTVRQQLHQITEYRRAARGALRDDLLRTEARWAEFAGWLSDDLGDRAAGEWWLAQALTMTQEVNDRDFTTYVFARMAQRASEATDLDRVPGLADAARRSGGNHKQVRAFAALQRAHGHAITGEATDFQRAVDDAHHLVADAAPTGGELGSFCTTAYVWAQEGDGWLRLGRPAIAVQRFDQALAAWPQSHHRDRGLYLARTAAAHAAAGEREHAAAIAARALRLANLTQSARTRREVASVSRYLTAAYHDPGVSVTSGSRRALAPRP